MDNNFNNHIRCDLFDLYYDHIKYKMYFLDKSKNKIFHVRDARIIFINKIIYYAINSKMYEYQLEIFIYKLLINSNKIKFKDYKRLCEILFNHRKYDKNINYKNIIRKGKK